MILSFSLPRLEKLLGGPVSLEVLEREVRSRDVALPPAGIAVILGSSGDLGALVLGLDAARRLIEAACLEPGGKPSAEPRPFAPLLPAEEGILLYLTAVALADLCPDPVRRPEVLGLVEDPRPYLRLHSRDPIAVSTLALRSPAGHLGAWLLAPAALDLAARFAPAAVEGATGVDIHVGAVELDPEDVLGLAEGDVIFPDQLTVSVDDRGGWSGDVLLEAGPTLRRGRIAGAGRIEILGDGGARPSGGPVRIALSLGHLALPCAPAAALAAGSVLDAAGRLEGPVVLRAGDRIIAEADLIDVDGRPGVRIRRLGA